MKILIASIFLMVSAQAVSEQNPIIGKWVSDTEKTIELIKLSTVFREQAKKAMITSLKNNNFIIEINKTDIISYYEGNKYSSKYKTLEIKPNTVKIKEYDKPSNKWFTKTIKLSGNFIVVPDKMSPLVAMVFKKIE